MCEGGGEGDGGRGGDGDDGSSGDGRGEGRTKRKHLPGNMGKRRRKKKLAAQAATAAGATDDITQGRLALYSAPPLAVPACLNTIAFCKKYKSLHKLFDQVCKSANLLSKF